MGEDIPRSKEMTKFKFILELSCKLEPSYSK